MVTFPQDLWSDWRGITYNAAAIALDARNFGCDEQIATELAVYGFMENI